MTYKLPKSKNRRNIEHPVWLLLGWIGVAIVAFAIVLGALDLYLAAPKLVHTLISMVKSVLLIFHK